MTGANCAFPNCGVARHHVGVGIFKIPTRNDEFHNNWRKEIIDIIIYRVADRDLKQRLLDGKVYVCERYFLPNDIEFTSKLCGYLFFIFCLGKKFNDLKNDQSFKITQGWYSQGKSVGICTFHLMSGNVREFGWNVREFFCFVRE